MNSENLINEFMMVFLHNSKNIHSDLIFKLDILEKAIDRRVAHLELKEMLKSTKSVVEAWHSDYMLLREYLRGEKEQRTEISIPDIERSLKYFENRLLDKKIRLSIEADRSNFSMMANVVDVNSILLNLISNSIDSFDHTRTKEMYIEISFERMDKTIIICCRDNGAGIPEDAQRHVFDPGFSTKKSAAGMGLAVVKTIVEDRYQGKIFLHSRPGNTTFEIHLKESDEH